MTKTSTPISKTDTITGTKREYTVTTPTRTAGKMVGITIDRTGWTDATAALTVTLLVSLNGGKTWIEWCGYTDKGGADLGPDGQPSSSSCFVATQPPDGALVKVSVMSNGKAVQQPVSLLEVT